MTEFYQFASQHPFLAFCAICAAYYTIKLPFSLSIYYLRSRNIRANGWPPVPMDADGDIVHPEKSQ